MEEKAVAAAPTVVGPRGSCGGRNPSGSLRISQPAYESDQPPLKSLLQDDPNPPPGNKALGQVDAASGGPAPSPQDLLPRKGILESSPSPRPPLHLSQSEERFIPLTGEVDYSVLEEIKSKHASRRNGSPDAQTTRLGRASQLPPGSRPMKEKWVADLPRGPSTHRSSPLDVLWAKYLERQNQQQLKPIESNHITELSLVERLDRLARLLQNPLRHSLALALEDQKEPRRKAARLASPRGKKMAARKKVPLRPSVEALEEAPVGSSGAWPSKSWHPKTGHGEAVEPGARNWDGGLASETPSETSSDLRPRRDASVATGVTSESEGTRIETESATATEGSESASTINTARLIRAFGQNRVQVSPKLSQLYSTIDLQKTRLESWAQRGRRAKGDGGGYPKMVHLEQKGKEAQPSPSFTSSDSVSSLGSSHGPSRALNSKRMSHKAIQAGDFEIVNSATKKHTRDVGLTFPTPTASQTTLHGGSRSRAEQGLAQHHGLLAENEEQRKWQPGSFLEGRRPRRRQSQWTQGVSWFVPARDLKPGTLEEAGGGFPPGPVLAWSEPPPRGKPWREPLREQNWPERLGGLQVRLAAPARDVENEPPSPLGKMTLQESLAMHRPDFISSSGERLKRLKLLTEERKLQSVFQGQREQLFNPPEAMSCRNMGGLANRGYRTLRSRAVSKNEMVERSKRIYEQLPEVRKKREEAQRRTEYSTNRLKAQLYKTKITNRVLGRKVPWE